MNKIIKGLSSAALSVACLFGVTGCGEKAKKIDFEENYETAQTAALSVAAVEESAEGFYVDMSMDMVMKTKVDGLDVEMTMEMDIYINHIGDNYYMETRTKMLGMEEVVGAAVEKESDGSFTGYYWTPGEDIQMEYTKGTLSETEMVSFEAMFNTDEASYGIKDIFAVEFENIEAAMKETIIELIDEDSFEDLPISIGSMDDLEITKSATEKGGKKTFKVTAKLPSQLEDESLSIMFGIVVDGEVVDSLLMEMKGEGSVEGVYLSYDADVVQHIEAAGRTDKTSLPKNVVWVEA